MFSSSRRCGEVQGGRRKEEGGGRKEEGTQRSLSHVLQTEQQLMQLKGGTFIKLHQRSEH